MKKIRKVYAEIAKAEADVIVNAANGCGWMGGKRCTIELHNGVAEHINYYTKGLAEKEAKIAARKYKHISSYLLGHKSGEIFVTSSCGLKCKQIVHAVTMRYPASRSNIKSVTAAIKALYRYCNTSGYVSIAIPCLGCGTGGLSQKEVIDIIKSEARKHSGIETLIYMKEK